MKCTGFYLNGNDLSTSVEKQVNNLVWSFVKENKITVPVYRQLKCDKSVTPKIYGLPQLHKSGIPLRPIVSFVGAPTYQLSKLTANLNKNDFFTVHFNTRSLSKNKNKIDDFLIDIERLPDAIAISETKLNANSSLNLNFSNYKFIRNDSITLAGGVGLYIKESLKFILRKDLSLNLQHCEDLWIEVESEKSNIILGVIYRHPKKKLLLFQDKLCKNLSKLENNKLNYIVNGDFNINTLAIKNPKVSNYANDLNSIGCKMLINIPTRFAENCKSSLLDHVYTNITNESIKSGVCIFEISDYFPTFFIAHHSKILHNIKTKFR